VDVDLKILPVRQLWPPRPPLDVAGRVRGLLAAARLEQAVADAAAAGEAGRRAFCTSELLDSVLPPDGGGPRVALTAGSRGIRDLAPALRTVAEVLRGLGCRPFVAPCMGSHGGATACGQLAQLEVLGITEESVGAPLVSSLDVVELATSRFGAPVVAGRDLAAADGIVPVNRIKPHTDFSGEIGSGIVKMLVIGMGKHRGAETAHRLALRHGFVPVLTEAAGHVLEHLPVLCALGIVEDQRDRTAAVELLDTRAGLDGLLPREKELQEESERLMPRLPFDELDVLVVDRMGKEISGAGIDCTVVGRRAPMWQPQPPRPRIVRIYVRELTPASHGNAIGIGMADFVSRRLLDRVDRRATEVNCLTSAAPEDARLPVSFETDREAVAACLATCGVLQAADARLAWIRDTADLETLWVSEALLGDVAATPDLEVAGAAVELPFDARGDLVSPFAPA
jgi:hypothetical protein